MPLTPQQQELAAGYADLAESQAWAFAMRTAGRMSIDCKSAAYLGLVQAIESWPGYCARNPGFDPSREDYQRAYILRRIRGAILDDARSADHLTRSDRKKAKQIRQAEDDGICDEAGQAAAAGLSIGETRRVQADAVPPVCRPDPFYAAGPQCLKCGGDLSLWPGPSFCAECAEQIESDCIRCGGVCLPGECQWVA